MSTDELRPSFFRFMVCCPFGAHRAVFCDCCGHRQCLDCCTELPLDASELEA